MAIKQKYAIYFKKHEAELFETVFQRARERNDHAEWSEVIKQLMGFPPEPGRKPLVTPEDRDLLASKCDVLPLHQKDRARKSG